jgi:hypothetical protein
MVEINTRTSTISIFKTDIESFQKPEVLSLLDSFDNIVQIDFDFEDRDHILRIDSKSNIAQDIESVLISNSIYCVELH